MQATLVSSCYQQPTSEGRNPLGGQTLKLKHRGWRGPDLRIQFANRQPNTAKTTPQAAVHIHKAQMQTCRCANKMSQISVNVRQTRCLSCQGGGR